MKRIQLLMLFALAVLTCVPSVQATGPDVDKTPTVYCNVMKQPDRALLGAYKCIFKLRLEEGSTDTNPAKYRLIKVGDQYALYFERIARGGKKRYMGWRDWTISGKEITSGQEIRIYAENGEVFFCWKDEKPVKMTKIE
jgi:hypothetical protein